MKDFEGNMLCLDRADINTDEIIPARYLTESSKSALKPHLLEDLILDGFNPQTDLKDIRVILSRGNFGCGSSREHAPWALEANGINVVIAPSFARIFRQNMFNCGMMAIELPEDKVQALFELGAGKD
ncbi:MAG: 3-isopropylmalate dehydratase small subunit 2, partial [Desulfobacter sp.]